MLTSLAFYILIGVRKSVSNLFNLGGCSNDVLLMTLFL